MATRPSNGVILEDLKIGLAEFELVSSPFPAIAIHRSRNALQPLFISDDTHLFFAKIPLPKIWRRSRRTSKTSKVSPALSEAESFSVNTSTYQVLPEFSKTRSFMVHKVNADGRGMFRALAKGMAMNNHITLSPEAEIDNADDLRRAIHDVLCKDGTVLPEYKEELKEIKEPLTSYCQRIDQPDFRGGVPELLVLSKLYRQPIIVYRRQDEHAYGSGFVVIDVYGTDLGKGSKQDKPNKVVMLLCSESNHYDLLV